MKILYIENSSDLEKVISKLEDIVIKESDKNSITSLAAAKEFDHILVSLQNIATSQASPGKAATEEIVKLHNIKLFKESNKVQIGDSIKFLSKKEHEILYALMTSYPKFLTKHMLAMKVWGSDDLLSNTLDVHLNRLRKKIGKSKIICIKGFGYKIKEN